MDSFVILALIFLTVYILLEWVLPWVWYPHLGRHKHPDTLPKVLRDLNDEFAKKAKVDQKFLVLWMDKLNEHYDTTHIIQFLHPERWFETDLEKIWNDNKVPQLCTIYNYLLESVLLNSKRFTREQIKHKTVFLNFSMHQYLEVTLKGGQTFELDLWGYDRGLPFGKAAKGFV